MRILTFTSLFPNIANEVLGIFIYRRMRHVLAHRDCTVDVVAPVPWSSRVLPFSSWRKFSSIPRREERHPFTIYHPRYFVIPKLGLPVQAFSMFCACYPVVHALHQRHHYDCIDAHYVYPDGLAAVLLGKSLGVPVVVSARGSDITQYPRFRTIRPMVRFTLRHADGLIAVSQNLANTMLQLGASAEKLQVIGNGVDPNIFHPVDSLKARALLAIRPSAKVVVCVGSLTEGKRQDRLIRAAAEVVKSFPELMVYCIGEGNMRRRLEASARGLGLSGVVQFPGLIKNEDLRYWYSAADVSCLTSSREGWPNVVLESMACGTPVIATRVGAVPDIIRSEFGVVIDEAGNELPQALRASLNRDWDRTAIVEYARQQTWDNVAQDVVSFLVACKSRTQTASITRATIHHE